MTHAVAVHDRLGRPLRDLRISVTDLCNFRCTYCMPRAAYRGHRFLPHEQLLGVDEIVRLVTLFVSLGTEKVRLTGGEPLLRRELPEIVARLSQLPLRDLALTTNGALLRRFAQPLRDAGLQRVTVSVDSLDPNIFATMSDARVPISQVVDGIAAAREAGLAPVKLNCVVRRGVNDAGVLDLVAWARDQGLTLRFIEYMDVGNTNHWQLDEVVSASELLERIGAVFPLEELPWSDGDVARRYRFRDGAGELGMVASVSLPFCGDCTRARLSADGRLFTCLFSPEGTDLRPPLRSGASDDELRALISGRWKARDDRYSEQRAELAGAPHVEMSYIGG